MIPVYKNEAIFIFLFALISVFVRHHHYIHLGRGIKLLEYYTKETSLRISSFKTSVSHSFAWHMIAWSLF
jgi:hypothetical protein